MAMAKAPGRRPAAASLPYGAADSCHAARICGARRDPTGMRPGCIGPGTCGDPPIKRVAPTNALPTRRRAQRLLIVEIF